MKQIDVLAKIDEFLEDKKDSEVAMLKICVFAVTAFLIYTFAYPAANEFYESEKARNIYSLLARQNNISRLKRYEFKRSKRKTGRNEKN